MSDHGGGGAACVAYEAHLAWAARVRELPLTLAAKRAMTAGSTACAPSDIPFSPCESGQMRSVPAFADSHWTVTMISGSR